MRTANAFNLNSLRSQSVSHRPCSLAVALHAHFHGLAEVQSSWNIWMCWFKIYSKWSVQTSIDRQADIYTHACTMQSYKLNSSIPARHIWARLFSRLFTKWENSKLPILCWFQYLEATVTSRQLDCEFKNTLVNSKLAYLCSFQKNSLVNTW